MDQGLLLHEHAIRGMRVCYLAPFNGRPSEINDDPDGFLYL
jgi:hypothetical protein